MNRRYALYLGDAILVFGVISVAVAFNDGILRGTTIASCGTPGKPPLPSIEFVGWPVQARVYGLYDSCNFTRVSDLFTYGVFAVLLGILALTGDRLARRHSATR